MKNRILSVYQNSEFKSSKASFIYVADFSERTKKKRGVEVHDSMPSNPNDESQDMGCTELHNKKQISIDFNIFDDNQFKDENGNDIEHCECCLFPTTNDDKSWITFIEIKDCKAKKISEYKEKAKNQIISTVELFRKNGIATEQRVYGIISFTRRNKTSFNDYILGDIVEQTALRKKYHILFYATNKVSIEDKHIIKNII
jgi:hypothetical protein